MFFFVKSVYRETYTRVSRKKGEPSLVKETSQRVLTIVGRFAVVARRRTRELRRWNVESATVSAALTGLRDLVSPSCPRLPISRVLLPRRPSLSHSLSLSPRGSILRGARAFARVCVESALKLGALQRRCARTRLYLFPSSTHWFATSARRPRRR